MATRKKKRQKNAAAVELGKRGARARIKNMTPEQRSEQAREAVNVRWARVRGAA